MTTTSQPLGRSAGWSLPAAVLIALLCHTPASSQDPDRGHPPADCPRIAAVRVTGNERTETDVILREMESRAGRCYNPVLVGQDRDRIDNLDLFSEVVIDSLRQDGRLVLEVRVKERLVWIPLAWIPYPLLNWTEENGWSYGLGVANPNSSGRNRRVSLLIQGGGERQAAFSYADPWIVGNHGSAAISVGYSRSEDAEGRTDRWMVTRISLGSYLGAWGRARLAFDAGEIETDPWRTSSLSGVDRLRSITLGAACDTRDVYADPRCGWYVSSSVGVAGGVLGGTVDYDAYRLDIRRFQPTWGRQTLAGSISIVTREGSVPDYHLLRLGGWSLVRGVHPVSAKGASRTVASAEYRLPIREKRSYDFWFIRNVDLGLMAAVFADLGAVSDENRVPPPDRFYGSVGAGVRILSQQVVRLEVAHSRRDGAQWILATGMPF